MNLLTPLPMKEIGRPPFYILVVEGIRLDNLTVGCILCVPLVISLLGRWFHKKKKIV